MPRQKVATVATTEDVLNDPSLRENLFSKKNDKGDLVENEERKSAVLEALENETIIAKKGDISYKVSKDETVKESYVFFEARNPEGMEALSTGADADETEKNALSFFNNGMLISLRADARDRLQKSYEFPVLVQKEVDKLIKIAGYPAEVARKIIVESPTFSQMKAAYEEKLKAQREARALAEAEAGDDADDAGDSADAEEQNQD